LDKNLRHLEKIAARARQETAPPVDVSNRVISRLSRPEPSPFRPLLIFTFVSIAAAALAIILSIGLFDSMTDPLWTMFQVMPVSG
jgi:hypothetical protein